MPQPTQNDVHVDAILTNMSIAFMQEADNFVASRAFPSVPVQKQSDKFFQYTQADFFRDNVQPRADGTESRRSSTRCTRTSVTRCEPTRTHPCRRTWTPPGT